MQLPTLHGDNPALVLSVDTISTVIEIDIGGSFNLKTRTGRPLLSLSGLIVVVGMAAMITRGRNPKTLKLYF